MRCIHDIDGTGFPIGCRDGSHLNNCGMYIIYLNNNDNKNNNNNNKDNKNN
jgi:hypothetical protein